jgi:CRP-like cAMP-binding protein
MVTGVSHGQSRDKSFQPQRATAMLDAAEGAAEVMKRPSAIIAPPSGSEAAQIAQILKACPHIHFGELSAPAVAKIASMSRVIDLPAGELLFRQGDHGDEAYAVLKGSCVTDPIPSRAAGAAGGASAAMLGALAQPGHRRSRERLHTSMNYQTRVASASKLLGGARAQIEHGHLEGTPGSDQQRLRYGEGEVFGEVATLIRCERAHTVR